MARLLKKYWWSAPLLPISYLAASRLTPPDSPILDPTLPQTVTKDQFKKGHLLKEFIRFIPDKDGDAAGKLELSIVQYKERLPGQHFHPNFAVDLVSVVHIGDRQYYEILQERLDNYGCVIYESVLETECTQNSQYCHNSLNKISFSWDRQSIRDSFKQDAHRFSLVQQNDYLKSRPSWKHGDLDWSTMVYLEVKGKITNLDSIFSKHVTQKEREKLVAICTSPLHDLILTSQHFGSLPWPATTAFLLPFITYLACSCNDPVLGSLAMLENFLNLERYSQPKFWQAWSLTAYYQNHENTSGLGIYSVLIGERNKVAINVLKDEIKKGEHSIAILYGAGHMPDFHKRLTEDFDLVPTSMNWITAWSVEDGPKSKYIQPFLDNFPSEGRTLILASLIFAALMVEILCCWVTCLTCIRFAVFLFSLFTN